MKNCLQATYLKLDSLVVRRKNLYKEEETTHFRQTFEQWNIPRLIEELVQSIGYLQRQKAVEEFNRLNIYRQCGLTILSNKYGIAFLEKFLNQAGALVHIYKERVAFRRTSMIWLFELRVNKSMNAWIKYKSVAVLISHGTIS